MEEIDCRGQVCPQPVLTTRNRLAQGPLPGGLCVRVDNRAAAENVCRFMENAGFACELEGTGGDFRVFARGDGGEMPVESGGEDLAEEKIRRRILVMLANDRIGRGDPVLGSGLMKNFLTTLGEMGEGLWRIICLNEGVRLAVQGAESLEALKALESRGVHILVCGTCLEHYGLTEKRAVGSSTNMLDIVTSLEVADTLINL